MDLSSAHKDLIRDLYNQSSRTVDDLPYTQEFDRMHAEFIKRSCREITKHDFWRRYNQKLWMSS